jgi:hypothetical protein
MDRDLPVRASEPRFEQNANCSVVHRTNRLPNKVVRATIRYTRNVKGNIAVAQRQ